MSATGVGSLPGTSAKEAVAIIAGELDEFVHVPELPARGPGSDMIGRTAGVLVTVSGEFALDTVPTGWRVIDSPGATMRRARSWLNEDLDELEDRLQGYTGRLKTQLVGPVTYVSMVEGRNGERLIADTGACREVSQALAVAARDHVGELRRRFPLVSEFVLQLDEPMFSSAVDGTIASASGLSRYRAIDEPVAIGWLEHVIEGASGHAVVGVHSCEHVPRVSAFTKAGAQFLSLDLRAVGENVDEPLGVALESRVRLFAGTVPSLPAPITDAAVGKPVAALGDRLGLSELVSMTSVITPVCGLAGAEYDWAIRAYRLARQAARSLRDEERAEQ